MIFPFYWRPVVRMQKGADVSTDSLNPENNATKNGGCYGEKFGLLQTLYLLMHPATLWPSQVLRLFLITRKFYVTSVFLYLGSIMGRLWVSYGCS